MQQARSHQLPRNPPCFLGSTQLQLTVAQLILIRAGFHPAIKTLSYRVLILPNCCLTAGFPRDHHNGDVEPQQIQVLYPFSQPPREEDDPREGAG